MVRFYKLRLIIKADPLSGDSGTVPKKSVLKLLMTTVCVKKIDETTTKGNLKRETDELNACHLA